MYSNQLFVLILQIILIFSCNEYNSQHLINPNCKSAELDVELTYNEVIQQFPNNKILSNVEEPDEYGALGRNRQAYLHVRFQMNMTGLTDFAVKFKRKDALDAFLKNLIYSFSFQLSNGSFELKIPENLATGPNFYPPSRGDSINGVAFFAYSLGLSLMTLYTSDWYLNHPGVAEHRLAIEGFTKQISKTLQFLKNKQNILLKYDAQAPNRLFF